MLHNGVKSFLKQHSYIASENLLIRFGKGNLPCLQCKVKALAMPSFWPEGIDNAFILRKNQCECLSFWPEGIANAFLFTLNGKFSLTIGMIMPLGWGEVTGIIPKLVTQGPFGFPTRHLWLHHLWLVGNPNGLSLGIIFSFHSWQATRERKKPVPLPQPKGIKTLHVALTKRPLTQFKLTLQSTGSKSLLSWYILWPTGWY